MLIWLGVKPCSIFLVAVGTKGCKFLEWACFVYLSCPWDFPLYYPQRQCVHKQSNLWTVCPQVIQLLLLTGLLRLVVVIEEAFPNHLKKSCSYNGPFLGVWCFLNVSVPPSGIKLFSLFPNFFSGYSILTLFLSFFFFLLNFLPCWLQLWFIYIFSFNLGNTGK